MGTGPHPILEKVICDAGDSSILFFGIIVFEHLGGNKKKRTNEKKQLEHTHVPETRSPKLHLLHKFKVVEIEPNETSIHQNESKKRLPSSDFGEWSTLYGFFDSLKY